MDRKKTRNDLICSALGGAALSAAVLFVIYAVFGLYPYGDKSISWCDMNQQVVPLMCDLKDILSGKGDLFLSMQNAGGMGFWGVFFFFLASPFSLLVAFVDKADMLVFMNVLVLIKLAFSGATAALFFRRVFPRLASGADWGLALAYSLGGFSMLFYQNVIWLDMLWSFPLLLLSLLRLSDRQKPLCFVGMLSLTMVMNYYIGYMVVVFLLIAVPLWIILCLPKEKQGQVALLFLVSCAVAALLTAVVWLPSMWDYVDSARRGSVIDSLAEGSLFSQYETKMQVLFCTPLIFAALPFVSLHLRGTDEKERRHVFASILFLLLLTASVLEPINKMWQTGNYQSFPLRYGYMIVLLGLTLAASVLDRQADGPKLRQLPMQLTSGVFCTLAILAASFALYNTSEKEITRYTAALGADTTSFLLILVWCLVAVFAFFSLLSTARRGIVSKRVTAVFLCLCVTACCLFNGAVYIGSVAHDDEAFRKEADLAERIEDDSFYRVKMDKKYFAANRVGALGYNSLSHYTSLTGQDYMFAMKKLGYSSYWMEVDSNGGTLLTDAILRNRYVISGTSRRGLVRDNVYRNERFFLLKSPYTLPAAVVLTADPAFHASLPEGSRGDRQQALYELYGGEGQLITFYETTGLDGATIRETDGLVTVESPNGRGRIRYAIDVVGRQSLYFDAFKDLSNSLREAINDSFSVTVNGEIVQSKYPSQASNGLLWLGDYENETVTVTVSVDRSAVAASFGVFGLDDDKLDELCRSAKGCDLSVDGNRVTACIDGRNGDYLYTCLPYEEGYTATVNGLSVPVLCVNDAFIAVPLSDGTNEVVLTYRPRGFIAGLVLSLLGAVLLAVAVVLRRRSVALPDWTKRVSRGALLGAGVIVFAAVYIFPLLVFAVT